MLPDINQLKTIVIQAAQHELLPHLKQSTIHFKHDGSILTSADLGMQRRLQEELKSHWPSFHMLGEEMPEEEQQTLLRDQGTGLWCLDPLDGTSNFAAGIPFFCVSLALIQNGRPVIGIVYDPIRDECFWAVQGKGAWLNRTRLEKKRAELPLKRAIGVVDFKRLDPELAGRLAQHPPYSSQRSFGSVALDWCWLAAGRYHVYLHGKQKIWDYAAGSLILAEVGGYALTLDGEEVFKPDVQPRSVFAALDEDLFKQWHSYLRV
jgi:myo-inositol-1(or 4)-monophosphatase